MQTFLPYSSYARSARCLDNKRLGKQRVECKQILLALGVEVGSHTPKNSRWKNHPAVRMWRGYELALCGYSQAVCVEWINRGFKDSLGIQFVQTALALREGRLIGEETATDSPPWLGAEDFHASHRSNLLRKDPAHYGKFGWIEPDDLPYVWPVEKEQAC